MTDSQTGMRERIRSSVRAESDSVGMEKVEGGGGSQDERRESKEEGMREDEEEGEEGEEGSRDMLEC